VILDGNFVQLMYTIIV